MDRSERSISLIRDFESSGFFHISGYTGSPAVIEREIDFGRALIALVIPRDFEKKIERHETAQIQLIINGSDGNTASIAAGYAGSICGTYGQKLSIEYLDKAGRKFVPAGQVFPIIRVWYNPLLLTRNFMVPAIVGMLLSIITLLLTSLAVVKEKEIGTLEQLIVTPLKPFQLIIGKLIPFTILGFIVVLLIILAMNIIFSITVRGSITLLLFSAFLYILSTLGLGIFVSTISKTQQQAMMVAIFVVLMPMVYLSGFAFPIENMPQSIQIISYIIPLKYFLTCIRSIVLKGVGFADLWQELLILFVMGVTILSLSVLRFRKRLE
jgi:ABC-2 type transport system permease protein